MLSYCGVNKRHVDPDDPEYDHTEPENDGQTGRRRRWAGPRYAPQT